MSNNGAKIAKDFFFELYRHAKCYSHLKTSFLEVSYVEISI